MQQILEVVEKLRKLKDSIAGRKRGVTIHDSEGTIRKITVNARKRGIVGAALLRHPLVSHVGLKIGGYG
ncbi:MAG: hypothetical protein Q8R15_05010, partial [Candidatus Micrarchaeota archaeon]|nr:hypothetical protein [Candidatus Micrarchaeota archaeon]